MEGQSSLTDPMQLVPLDFCGDAAIDVSQATGDDPSQQVSMATEGTAYQTDDLFSPWWTEKPKPSLNSLNCVEFLAESSTFLPKDPCEDILESIPLSVSGTDDVGGVSEFQRHVLYSSLGNACGSKLTDFSMDMDDWKQVRCLRPVNDELVNAQHQLHAKYHTSRTDNLYGDKKDGVSQVDPRARSALPDFHSQPHRHISTQRAALTDRSRRMRIAERLDALRELLPISTEGGQSFVVDDVIDHIKFLQLQIKDLCRSRLGGETITEPIIFREGYGHYFCHQKMLNEPLEEMMGKLLETNPMAASQLLENKDLLLLPMDYSEPLA
ncbi:uncharacterized protein LOC110749817 isoform X1 [Prunus avium]|uniref:Uncharacterized protein LOC110749817 isoform X1 n=1 Tax=Prunus avium TaxID=42229 RepID=A0A6P5RLE3_PRUAV|nr:uncharacterized protein LOC110749817 isoform X1 [Prunus avium]